MKSNNKMSLNADEVINFSGKGDSCVVSSKRAVKSNNGTDAVGVERDAILRESGYVF